MNNDYDYESWRKIVEKSNSVMVIVVVYKLQPLEDYRLQTDYRHTIDYRLKTIDRHRHRQTDKYAQTNKFNNLN